MSDQQTTRADWIFRILILLLAGLWLAFPPAEKREAQVAPTNVSELAR